MDVLQRFTASGLDRASAYFDTSREVRSLGPPIQHKRFY